MGTVGPYRLGQPLILVCVAEGKPSPTLLWTRKQPLIASKILKILPSSGLGNSL
jgi:hypothetical protein